MACLFFEHWRQMPGRQGLRPTSAGLSRILSTVFVDGGENRHASGHGGSCVVAAGNGAYAHRPTPPGAPPAGLVDQMLDHVDDDIRVGAQADFYMVEDKNIKGRARCRARAYLHHRHQTMLANVRRRSTA